MHWCANVVCGPEGTASAVLLRAGEVVEGVELARLWRPGCRRDIDLARGPARLTRAMGLDGAQNGVDVCSPSSTVWLRAASSSPRSRVGPRVGVGGAGADPVAFGWRHWLDGEPTVSVYRPGRPPRGGWDDRGGRGNARGGREGRPAR
jgi:DNA-3-methyladenine glycosylase